LADYLYPRDKFVLIQKDGELYIQHRWFKLKVEVDGASMYLKAKWRTSEFQLSWSSDPKVLAYDALIILNLLNSYKRKLDISDEKAKEVDTEFPFKGEGDKSLSFYQEASWLKENVLRIWWLIYKDCEEESYLIDNNLTWVASSYKWNTKKLAAELNNLKDWSSKNRSIFRIGSDIPQSMVAEWVKSDWTYNSSTWVDGGFETNTVSVWMTLSRDKIKSNFKNAGNELAGCTVSIVDRVTWKDWIVTKAVVKVVDWAWVMVWEVYEVGKDWMKKVAWDIATWIEQFTDYLDKKINQPDSFSDYITWVMQKYESSYPSATPLEKQNHLIMKIMKYKWYALHFAVWIEECNQKHNEYWRALTSVEIETAKDTIIWGAQFNNIINNIVGSLPKWFDKKYKLEDSWSWSVKDWVRNKITEYVSNNYSNSNMFEFRFLDNMKINRSEFKTKWTERNSPNGPLWKVFNAAEKTLNAWVRLVDAAAVVAEKIWWFAADHPFRSSFVLLFK
jgi:hypothetical protein